MSANATLAEAEHLLKSGKLYPLQKSLLRSAVDRARSGDPSDLAGRVAMAKERIASQDRANAAESAARDVERARLVEITIRTYRTPTKIRALIAGIDAEREKLARRGNGTGFGLTHDPIRTMMERRCVLGLALERLENADR